MYDFDEPFCALFAGLPQPEWRDTQVLILQGYFDDSGSDDGNPVFVLAGFLAPADVWANFTAVWRAALNKAPAIGYLHMAELNRLEGQFSKGWSKPLADQRAFEFVEIIGDHKLTRVHTAMKRADFENYLRKFDYDPAFKNPYFFLFYKILSDISGIYTGEEVTIQTIFDEQGVTGTNAIRWWDAIAEHYPDRFDKFERPIFANDRRHLPLQAADVYAWHLRKHLRDGFMRESTIAHRHIIKVFADLPIISLFLETGEVEELSVALKSAQEAAMRGERPKF